MEIEQMKYIMDGIWETSKQFVRDNAHLPTTLMVFHKDKDDPEMIDLPKYNEKFGLKKTVVLLKRYLREKDPDGVLHLSEANGLIMKIEDPDGFGDKEMVDVMKDIISKYDGRIENVPHNSELLVARGFVRGGQVYEKLALIDRSKDPVEVIEDPYGATNAVNMGNGHHVKDSHNWLDFSDQPEPGTLICPKCAGIVAKIGAYTYRCKDGHRFSLLDDEG